VTAQNQAEQTKTWHVASWGTLGWLETLAKGVGILAGIAAFFNAQSLTPAPVEGFANIAAAGLMGFLALGVTFSILIRIYQKEIISIIFAIFSALGHLGMAFYLLRGGNENVLPVILGVAYIVGELIKQRFIATTGYSELGVNSSMITMGSRGLLVAYLIFTVLVLVA
jgi:hypothetical protein